MSENRQHYLHHLVRKYRFEIFESMTLGSNESEVDLFLEQEKVGEVHCRFFIENNHIYIVDLNSGYPTRIRSKTLRPYHPYRLKEGDILYFGPEPMVYSQELTLNKSGESQTSKIWKLGTENIEQWSLGLAFVGSFLGALALFIPEENRPWAAMVFAFFGLLGLIYGFFKLEHLLKAKYPRMRWSTWALRCLLVLAWSFWLGLFPQMTQRNSPIPYAQDDSGESFELQRLPASKKESN